LIRWQTCVDLTTFYFGAKVSQLFADHYHGDKIKGATQKLIVDLRSSFAELIKEASWMDVGKPFYKHPFGWSNSQKYILCLMAPYICYDHVRVFYYLKVLPSRLNFQPFLQSSFSSFLCRHKK
jgi:hypothetical protein